MDEKIVIDAEDFTVGLLGVLLAALVEGFALAEAPFLLIGEQVCEGSFAR